MLCWPIAPRGLSGVCDPVTVLACLFIVTRTLLSGYDVSILSIPSKGGAVFVDTTSFTANTCSFSGNTAVRWLKLAKLFFHVVSSGELF